MNAKDRLFQEIELMPEQLLDEILEYLSFLKWRNGVTDERSINSKAGFDKQWWQNLDNFTHDFLEERSQPELPQRDDIFL